MVCTITYELWYTQKLSNNLCAGSATRYCSGKRAVQEGYIGKGACLCGSKVLAPVRVAAKPSHFALLAPRQAAAQLPRSLFPPPAALPCSPYAYFLSPISFVRAKEIGPAEHDGTNYCRIVPFFTANTLRGPNLFARPKRIG